MTLAKKNSHLIICYIRYSYPYFRAISNLYYYYYYYYVVSDAKNKLYFENTFLLCRPNWSSVFYQLQCYSLFVFELKWMDRYWHFHIYLVLTDVDGFYFNACLKMKKFLYSMRNLTIIRAKVVRQSSLMHCTLRVHDTSSPITSLCLKLHLQSLP